MKTVAKDLFYRYAPLPLVRAVVPRIAPGSTPFLPAVLESRVIFVHVPKAAGSSVKAEIYGRPQGGHRSIAEFYAFDPDRAAAFFKFGFVRNPWDRLYSAHSYLVQRQGTSGRDRRFAEAMLRPRGDFAGFVAALEEPRYRRAVTRYDHFRSQAHWIRLPGQGGHALDFLGRFERMAEDMAEVRARVGLPERELGRTRTSDHAPYREAYTARMRDIVGEVYAEDVTLLGYGF